MNSLVGSTVYYQNRRTKVKLFPGCSDWPDLLNACDRLVKRVYGPDYYATIQRPTRLIERNQPFVVWAVPKGYNMQARAIQCEMIAL